jgi:hypothetical protein
MLAVAATVALSTVAGCAQASRIAVTAPPVSPSALPALPSVAGATLATHAAPSASAPTAPSFQAILPAPPPMSPVSLPPATATPPASPPPGSPPPTVPVLDTAVFPLATGLDDLTTYGGSAYGMRITTGGVPTMSIIATDGQGRTRTALVRTGAIAGYYHHLSAGPFGLYASTSVIKRFSGLPDEVIRIDPATLRVTRRIVGLAVEGPFVTSDAVYLQLSPSTLSRVDPVTLQVRASYSGLLDGDPPTPAGYLPEPLSSYGLTLGEGSLWLIHGDSSGGTIMRFDPMSLRRLPGSWPVGPGQGGFLVGTPHAVWRVRQSSAARLLSGGAVSAETQLPEFPDAVADGDGLLVLSGTGRPELPLVVSASGVLGRIASRVTAEACGWLASDGQRAWMFCGSHDLVDFPLPPTQ